MHFREEKDWFYSQRSPRPHNLKQRPYRIEHFNDICPSKPRNLNIFKTYTDYIDPAERESERISKFKTNFKCCVYAMRTCGCLLELRPVLKFKWKKNAMGWRDRNTHTLWWEYDSVRRLQNRFCMIS